MVTNSKTTAGISPATEELQQMAEATQIDAAAQTTADRSASAEDIQDETAAVADENNNHSGDLADAGNESAEAQSAADEYAGRTKNELLELLEQALGEKPVLNLRHEVEAIKVAFYKMRRAEVDAEHKTFIEANGEEAEFSPSNDDAELKLKELLKEYRRRRDEFTADLDKAKEENYRTKLAIIEELKELIDTDETLGSTFARFRELQQRWKDTGAVPQQHVKDLWETYNLYVENFYNFIKINKDLRDLDLKKNLERKEALCTEAEALAEEKSIIDAFNRLQKLHDEWRETGPVAKEFKEQLWERFKAASTVVNKRHQAYFEMLKEEQVRNLEQKSRLCEEVEKLVESQPATLKAWNRATEKLQDIQTRWKGIGFAPRKENNKIYERFRAACDNLFEMKRAFFASLREEMDGNYKLKVEICEAAEALRDSEEWKEATDKLIALQAEWKKIGAVSRRHSDTLWKRFRAACDSFFERKAAHFASVGDEYEDNLNRKTALIAEMLEADIENGGYELIREFQRRWSEIGFVPIKAKNTIRKQYKEAVDKMFNVLRSAGSDKAMTRFREKVSSMAAAGDRRLNAERERLYNKVRRLEQDIALLENNIGFFSKSANADSLIADVNEKIQRTKQELAETIEKVKMIDENSQN
ncbi:MAG: DUF349 domain-containing protein [Alistipes sp.]|nr:DUF349 domain-containing protein [Alistipes sp.]